MSTKKPRTPQTRLKQFDRHMVRSMFISLFSAVITDKRQKEDYTFSAFAKDVGTNKFVVSRWFSKEAPNWTLDTIADIAGALNLELRVEARDRKSMKVFAPNSSREVPRTIEDARPSQPVSSSTKIAADFRSSRPDLIFKYEVRRVA